MIVCSVEGTEKAERTQSDFPHLVVLADKGHGLTDAVQVLHARAAPDGSDADAPTTILVDRHGKVRWLYRPSDIFGRLSPDELLRSVDQHLR